jgi:hypothetical protein
MSRALLQQALEALEQVKTFSPATPQGRAITAIRAHLATPEQVPAAWWDSNSNYISLENVDGKLQPLYLSPTIPTGYVLVPEEPTETHLEAMSAYADDLSKYRALTSLAAAKGE